MQELAECGLSVKSTGSDQEWSYTLYDFEGQGKVTREVRARFADVFTVPSIHNLKYKQRL